ncbi:multidrug ABC transporter permease [Streptococcus sp. X16XC17]|uniref:ABC transporter permease n=1 Tax=unclassified Streptococcus TaxID=2608887 RepID=UPI00066FFCC1|nr:MULTISPECIES: ABC transporter permease [unclassified Streptococcus]TCD45655.1 multidrug ABC transporter permease [Streptococcus sp. X16XC17]
MKELFQQRRTLFHRRCIKYLRYVLNGHFVLILMVFLGFLLSQYRAVLVNFPDNPWLVVLPLAGLTLLLLFAGKIATYLEAADQTFLLPKEQEVLAEIHSANQKSFLLWGSLQVLGQLLVYPLYLKLGLSPLVFGIFILLLSGIKYWLFQHRFKQFQGPAGLRWDWAINQETQRQQVILQFFSLFTNVKGISTSVKRRKYLDGLLGLVKKDYKYTWSYLYFRAFLRSGDFFHLTLRLLGLSMVFLIVIKEAWLSVGMAVVFDYLLLFQLLSLYSVYDYQYLSQLYPVQESLKKSGFERVIRMISYAGIALQILLGIFFVTDKAYLLFLLGLGIFLNQLYLPMKSKKLID